MSSPSTFQKYHKVWLQGLWSLCELGIVLLFSLLGRIISSNNSTFPRRPRFWFLPFVSMVQLPPHSPARSTTAKLAHQCGRYCALNTTKDELQCLGVQAKSSSRDHQCKWCWCVWQLGWLCSTCCLQATTQLLRHSWHPLAYYITCCRESSALSRTFLGSLLPFFQMPIQKLASLNRCEQNDIPVTIAWTDRSERRREQTPLPLIPPLSKDKGQCGSAWP